ncbi:methionyl-tRNA formyltransferase [Lactococcus termiticola]|nr:methionyl-tRNA formyltransferase [Lactococcus termiticola]
MTKTKIIFMGTPEFSATVLKGILESGQYEVLTVVTQPDRPVGRKRELKGTPVKAVAVEHGLPVLQPEKLSGSEELEKLIALGQDEGAGIITAAFGQFLPGKLLDNVAFAVNVHASLLPKYRGGAPIHYALMNDEKEMGVTLMEMVRKMDAGDMIAQGSIPVLETDNVGSMFEKLAVVGRDLLLDKFPAYLAGDIKPEAQDESQATFSPNIAPEEEVIDWTKSAREIFNQIRGMNPWPVAHTTWNDGRFKIYEAQETEGAGQAGQVIEKTKKSLVIACGKGALSLKLVQPAGRAKMEVANFLNGLGQKIEIGDAFGK